MSFGVYAQPARAEDFSLALFEECCVARQHNFDRTQLQLPPLDFVELGQNISIRSGRNRVPQPLVRSAEECPSFHGPDRALDRPFPIQDRKRNGHDSGYHSEQLGKPIKLRKSIDFQ